MMQKALTITFSFFLLGFLVYMVGPWNHEWTCDPKAAKARLLTHTDQGILDVQHPPSQSNLLWVQVGPAWHALSEDEKRSLDRLVRCAAQTIDEHGQPTWQAAYYDQDTKRLAALSSRKWGFRLKDEESHFSQNFQVP